MATLIISSEEMEDIMKIVKYFEDFVFLMKGDTQTISKWKSSSRNMLEEKKTIWAG